MPDDSLLTVTLKAHHAEALRSAVASSEYPTIEDALADALDSWAGREEQRADDLLWMKAKINAALDDPSPSLSIDEVKAHMEAVYANARARRNEAA